MVVQCMKAAGGEVLCVSMTSGGGVERRVGQVSGEKTEWSVVRVGRRIS